MAESPTTDEELVKYFLAGNEQAFTELVRRHKAWVIAKAARYTRNSHETDDLAQTIFIKAFKKIHDFNFKSPFRLWLASIATNACYDHLRKRRVNSWLSFLPLKAEEDSPHLPEIPDTFVGSGNELQNHSHPMLPFLFAAMQQLASQDQLLLTLKEIEQKSLEEISSLTGWTIANIKVRSHRARKKLKKILEKMLKHSCRDISS